MPKLIFIDQIAQGGEQGWSQPHIPQSEREPEVEPPMHGKAILFGLICSIPFWAFALAVYMKWIRV